MERFIQVLVGPTARRLAHAAINRAPENFIVEIKPPNRSWEQNKTLHGLLRDVSQQVVWYGQKLCIEDWKRIFAAALQGVRVVPGLESGTFVPVGLRTRDMTVPEMRDMITLVQQFGAERGVVFFDQSPPSPRGIGSTQTGEPRSAAAGENGRAK